MTDLENAIKNLSGHTLSLCKNGNIITSDKRGISPMINYLQEETDLNGYSAADRVVGKAVAMLLIKAGIKEVFAQTLSRKALAILNAHSIAVYYNKLTDFIINRDKTGMCPMEKTVENIDNIEDGYKALVCKLNEMRN